MNKEIELKNYLNKLFNEYEARTRKSKELFEKAYKYLPGGVDYSIRFFKPYPLFIVKGDGPYVWDVDGNQYIDLWMGHGVNILGHKPDFVLENVDKIERNGINLGFENPYVVEYAEFLVKTLPHIEQFKFCNTGTEANMYALRLARAFTKRNYIIKIEGGWHGGLDQLHYGVYPPFNELDSLGIPRDYVKYTLLAPFNELDVVEKYLRKYDVACILLEPVPGAGGCIEPSIEYLNGLRKLTNEYGALLVFDEVITGFRLSYGGAQEYFNIRADLVIYGKILGGGYPGAGGFAGSREIMEYLDQVKRPHSRDRCSVSGTFIGNTVTIIAGYTLIKYLYENRDKYESFNKLWRETAMKLDSICEHYDRLCWITNVGNLTGIHFTENKPLNVNQAYLKRWSNIVYDVAHVYFRLNNILYMTPHMIHFLPSMIHNREHCDRIINTFEKLINELRNLIK
uniref:Aminotransferase class III-fold pyridoxal phosphate-dependent enzyme n=1 Tax=Staphylothermus marinus TaxID=2280 RepID=A0A7C4D8Q0_STAMA